jgi:hypothetical protein
VSQAPLKKQQPDNELSTAISGNSADSHPVNLAKVQPPNWVVGRNSKGGSFFEKRAALKISSGDKGDVPVKTVNPLTVIIANKRGDGF